MMREQDSRDVSLLAKDQYMREVREFERLEEEEESRLLACIGRAKCEPENQWLAMKAKYARDRLVEQYQPLVIGMVKRCAHFYRRLEFLDLVNEASIGLMEAIEQYHEAVASGFGGSLTAFIVVCLRRVLWHVRYEQDGAVRLPKHMGGVVSRLGRASRQFLSEHGYEPPLSVLADLLQLPESQVKEAQEAMGCQQMESLQGMLWEDEDEDRQCLVSLFQASGVVEDERHICLRDVVRRVLDRELTPREREIVDLRYGLQEEAMGEWSVTMVAEHLGVSRSMVGTLGDRAKERLKHALEPFVTGAVSVSDFFQAYQQECYTAEEVAVLLRITVNSVRRAARQGRLPVHQAEGRSVRVNGRAVKLSFPKAAIDALVSVSA